MTHPLPVSEPASPVPPLAEPRSVLTWNLLALLWALATVGGSLWLSLGMGLQACPLCFYQRSFAMGTAAILLMALLARHMPHLADVILSVDDEDPLGAEADTRIAERFGPGHRGGRQHRQ